MINPFKINWLKGWSFQVVILGSNVKIEAYGYGLSLDTFLLPGESPKIAADRLVNQEEARRKSLYNSFLRQRIL